MPLPDNKNPMSPSVSELPTSWTDAFKVIFGGNLLGLTLCGTALPGLGADAVVFGWLEIAALLFALGIMSSLFAVISVRSAVSSQHEMRQSRNSPLIQDQRELRQKRSVERLVIACLLTLGSAVTFFCGCATAFMALVRS